QAAYSAAKYAARGFTDALRAELLHEQSPVRLAVVELPGLNTPQFDWARTHQPNQPRPMAPVYSPEAAARAILRAARVPRREYWLGWPTVKLILGNQLAPGLLDRYLARTAYRGQDTGAAVSPERPENLFAPVPGRHH